MSGRMYKDQLNEQWIETKLNIQPDILRKYINSTKNKTSLTRKTYLRYLINFFEYLEENDIEYTKTKSMDIDDYINRISCGNGNEIVNARISAIISFYKFLVENEMIDKNPCNKQKKLNIQEKENVTYLTDKEIETIKNNIRNQRNKIFVNRDLCLFGLGCTTGLRISALVNIDVDDIDFTKKTITVIEKGNKRRTVYLADKNVELIQRWMNDRNKMINNDDEKALFISQKKERWSVRSVQSMIEHVSKGIDKHITPHKMRSTCAMRLYEKEHDIYLVQQQLGHKNIQNTMIYAKATEERMRHAAEILA